MPPRKLDFYVDRKFSCKISRSDLMSLFTVLAHIRRCDMCNFLLDNLDFSKTLVDVKLSKLKNVAFSNVLSGIYVHTCTSL